jgi:hypothetical protein
MLKNDIYRIDNQRSIPGTGMFVPLHHKVHSRYEVIYYTCIGAEAHFYDLKMLYRP